MLFVTFFVLEQSQLGFEFRVLRFLKKGESGYGRLYEKPENKAKFNWPLAEFIKYLCVRASRLQNENVMLTVYVVRRALYRV